VEAGKLFKKGELAKGEDGSLLLVNEDKATYKVNEAVLMIWDMCNGILFSQIVSTISAGTDEDIGAVKTSLQSLINELQQAKLLEIKQLPI